jgi:WD40 repeat protein
VDAKVEINAL